MADEITAETRDGDAKDVYVYFFDVENTIVEAGGTRNLHKRQGELRREWADDYGVIETLSLEPVTLAEAKRKLDKLRDKGWPVKMETLNQL